MEINQWEVVLLLAILVIAVLNVVFLCVIYLKLKEEIHGSYVMLHNLARAYGDQIIEISKLEKSIEEFKASQGFFALAQ